MVAVNVPLSFASDVLVKVLGHVGGEKVFVFHLERRRLSGGPYNYNAMKSVTN